MKIQAPPAVGPPTFQQPILYENPNAGTPIGPYAGRMELNDALPFGPRRIKAKSRQFVGY
jgi:hypothetical protein